MSLLLLSAFLAACGAAAGADNPGVVELAAASSSAVLGAPVVVQARAHLEPGADISLDLQRSTTDSFAITGIKNIPGAAAAERRFELTIVPLDLGRRAFPLYWNLAAAGSTSTIATQLQLEVSEPPDAAKAGDIKDIKPPRSARPRLWPLLLLAAAILAIWYWNVWRNKRRRELAAAAGPEPDPRPPEVIAETELAQLESSGLWEQGRHKEFYSSLTDILRRYLERRYVFPATHETTAEIYRWLRRQELDRQLLSLFKDLFDQGDLVKFAKIAAQDSWGALDLAAARRLVRETTPAGIKS